MMVVAAKKSMASRLVVGPLLEVISILAITEGGG
jgi:hypothetical protein